MPESLPILPVAAPGLPWEYRLLEHAELDSVIRYTVECTTLPHACPYCGAKPKPWGSKARIYLDIPRGWMSVEYHVLAKRFRCSSCKKTFLQELPSFNQTHGLTRRYYLQIGERCFTHTYSELGLKLGIEDTSVRALFHNYLNELQSKVLIGVPEALALVPVAVVNRACIAFVNAKAKVIVDLQHGHTPKVLAPKLAELAASGITRSVAIGLDKQIRAAIQTHLGHAGIYVDPFFVLQAADVGVELTRKAVRKPLTTSLKRYLAHDAEVLSKARHDLTEFDLALMNYWFALYPPLQEAYQARESIRDVYQKHISPDAAFAQINQSVEALSPKVRAHFRSFTKVMGEFETEVKAFFSLRVRDHPLTAIEGLQSLGDWIDAISSRGKVFEVTRASVLYPARMPGRSFRTPGTSISRLRSDALKKRSP